MNIIAVSAPGGPTLDSIRIGHGEDPRVLLWQRGYFLVRYLSASAHAEELTLTVQVGAIRAGMTAPIARNRGRDHGLGRLRHAPVVKQRVACYAIVLSSRGLLATRFSRRTSAMGTWGLPGGGREPGEQPAMTVLREVLEETGQEIRLRRLLDLQSDHWVGRSPNGVVEDFHALRVLYLAHCENPGRPVVRDVGGTTADAMWVPTGHWRSVAWSASTRALLDVHLPTLVEPWASPS